MTCPKDGSSYQSKVVILKAYFKQNHYFSDLLIIPDGHGFTCGVLLGCLHFAVHIL